jgi:hypothetical protein
LKPGSAESYDALLKSLPMCLPELSTTMTCTGAVERANYACTEQVLNLESFNDRQNTDMCGAAVREAKRKCNPELVKDPAKHLANEQAYNTANSW